MNKTIPFLISLLFLGCQDEENARTVQEPAQAPVSTEETISMAEHERLLGEAEAATEAMVRELTHQVRSFQTAFRVRKRRSRFWR